MLCNRRFLIWIRLGNLGLKRLSRAHGPCPFTEVPYRSFLQTCLCVHVPIYAPQIAHPLFFLQEPSCPSLLATHTHTHTHTHTEREREREKEKERERDPFPLLQSPTFFFPPQYDRQEGISVWTDAPLPALQGSHNNSQHINQSVDCGACT